MENMIFTRHGESEFNLFIDEGKVSAIPKNVTLDRDTPLTQKGVQDAMNLGEKLAATLVNTPIDYISIFSSPFARAIETAQIAIARINEPRSSDQQVVLGSIDERLREGELGLTEPLYALNDARLHKIYEKYWERRNKYLAGRLYELPVPAITAMISKIAKELNLKGVELTGENLLDQIGRMRSWYLDDNTQRVINASGMQSVVFAHGGTTIASRIVIEGLSIEETVAVMNSSIPNASRTTYSRENGKWELTAWAEASLTTK